MTIPKKKQVEKTVIGRKEVIDLPELHLNGIVAKIDTGAYTSAIHCRKISVYEDEHGNLMVEFQLLDPGHPQFRNKRLSFPVHKFKGIKSSNGQIQQRYIIKTTANIAGRSFKIEFSLADRSRMENPVLIGRKALKNRFIVDVSL